MKESTLKNVCLLPTILFLMCLQSMAQTFKPFSIRENIEIKGSMLVIGNNILSENNLPFNDTSRDNQDVNMQYVDIDSDGSTFNSSSANLLLAPHEDGSATDCYRVVYAGLYWGAILQEGDRSAINKVKFKFPGSSSYVDIDGEIVYDAIGNPIVSENNEPENTPYASYADVTDLLSGLADIEGEYTVANVISSLGFNNSTGLAAGWTLVVIYEDPSLHTKSFTTFDGFSHIFDSHEEEVPVTGFATPPSGHIDLQFAYATLDGDRTKRATKLEINGKEVTTPLRTANKFFGSIIENINGVSHPRNPFSDNTLGYDTGFLEIKNSEPEYIKNNDTSASFMLQVARGQADPIFSFFSAFAVDIIAPDIALTKVVQDEFGNDIDGDDVILGQNVFYEITYQSVGNDNVTQFTIKDILPENIIFDPNTGIDLSNAGGAVLQSYDPVTKTIIFNIPDGSVEVNDPSFVIRLAVQVVPNCYDLSQACSNEVLNQAFATYQGVINPTVIQEEGSFANTECLGYPGPTNFIVNISNCNFEKTEILCGDNVLLTAADGYDSYSWSSSPSGTPVIGTAQTYTATETGTYYVTNSTASTCLSIDETFNVITYGNTITNPVIPYADLLPVCPNDGKVLPYLFLCGGNDTREIVTGISDAVSIIWEKLDESSCPAEIVEDCANEDDNCTWNQVASGSNFTADTSGQFRLVINYPGGCYSVFYFNVYTNLLTPTITSRDILCSTPGEIVVGGVPSGYEYSLAPNGPFQLSNQFTVANPGYYTIYIRQIGVDTNPCIFQTPEVYVRQRDFSVNSTILQPECFDGKGTIILAANDARPQYFYSIYDGATLVNMVGPITASDYTFSNLNPGIYTVNVSTEDGCTYTEDIEIINPSILTATVALTTPLTCTEGEITIYPVGGTSPYTYYINSTIESQDTPEYAISNAGTYNITVIDFNGCTANTSIEVDAALAPEFTVSTTDIVCADAGDVGSINFNVTNTNGNTLQYSIDNGLTFSNSPLFTGLAAGNYDVVVQYTLGTAVCLTAPQALTITAASAIDGTATISTPYSCVTNGAITVTGTTGGTAPYTYSIDGINYQGGNTFTGLTAGTYIVNISDASGCTFIALPITIDALNPPTDLDFASTPLSCPAMTSDVTLTSTGGIAPLEYQIIAPAGAVTAYQSSNIFTGLAPGTYTFQVLDANDCTYAESFTIDPLPPLTVSTVITKDLDCTASPDGIITGSISGGAAPFSYAVSYNGGAYSGSIAAAGTSFTHAAPTDGTYQFMITDANGCTSESGVQTINVISLPEITSITSTPNLCNGESNGAIQITINNGVGTPAFTINVYNTTTSTDYGTQTTGLPAGDYTVTLTDSKSCTDVETITINEPDAIVVNYHAIDITCSAGGNSQGSIIIDSVTGGTPSYNYFVTGSNGYSASEINVSGTTSTSFNVVDFGLYQINVVDANGCSVLVQDVLVASPPNDLDISINAIVDCATGGEAIVSIGTTLVGAGPFYFDFYTGIIPPAPPGGTWVPEDTPGSQSATFTGLTPGVTYTFIVYDASTGCSYYETATSPIPSSSSLTVDALTANNITCVGSDDGNVTFNINSGYGIATTVDYEIVDALSLVTTGITGSGSVPAGGTLAVSNLGPLPYGNYFVIITETSGPNSGCGVVTLPFNISESAIDLVINATVDQNANCNPNSGVITAQATFGTAPYQYQITTTPAPPIATDPSWNSNNVFNMDANSYYVHVMDAYGCIKTTPVIVLPADSEPVITANVTNQCSVTEGNFEIDVNLTSAGIMPYSFSIDGGAFQTRSTPFTISNLASGTHTIEIQDANGCGNLVSVDVVAPLGLTPDVTAMPSCNNDDGEITITGLGGTGTYTYGISPSPASIGISGNVISGVPSGTYTITITDATTACTETVDIFVPEAILPIITTIPTAVTCFGGNTGAFELNVNGYSGAYTYEVFDSTNASVFGVVNANTSTNPELISGLVSGTYSVVLTETANPFCSTTADVIIQSPLAPLMVTTTEISNVTCDDNRGTISAIADGGWGSTYEYELTGAATVAYSSNGTFSNLSAGTYTVNVRDGSGCVVSDTITLDAPTPISAAVVPSTTLLSCFGDDNASITINASGGFGSNYSYTLNMVSPTVTSSGPQSSNVFTDLGAGTYNVLVTDGYNCSFASADVTINAPTPIQSSLVAITTPTCTVDATLTLAATGGTGTYTYSTDASFTTVLGTFTTSTTFSVLPGTYQYYVQDANGCVSSVSNEITVDPLPSLMVNVDATNATINCAGDNTGVIVATAQGGLGSYVYTLQDGSGNAITPAPIQITPGVFTNLIAGTYQVQVDSGDCLSTSATIDITEPSAPLEANFTVTDVTCSGSSDGIIEITATGGTGVIKYAISPQLNQFFDSNIFENLAPGTYQAVAQDELGCFVILDFTINDPIPVVLTIVAGSIFPEVCEGDLNGEFSIDISGGSLPYSVSLDDINGTYTTGTATQTQFDFTALAGGDHIVYVRDALGCESEWNITFPESVLIDPQIEIEYGCVNNSASNIVTVTVDDSITDLSDLDYALDGGAYQASNIFVDVLAGIGHYIDVRHTNGCIQRTALFDITDFAPLTLSLNDDELNTIEAITTGGSAPYEYTLNGESFGSTNTFNIYASGDYTVEVTDRNGCIASATIYVEFIDVCIPNYFTPNGDGVLDQWGPGCTNQYSNLTFDIFDRYGRVVATLRAGQKWDGTYDGAELPTGDYWYVVKLNDNVDNREFVGHFTLYR